MTHREAADYVNTLADFCAVRDLPALTQEAIEAQYGFRQADVMALFGGSILCGGDLLAEAMRQKVAKIYLIVGGAGHTTPALRAQMEAELPGLDARDATEAELFDAYLWRKYGLRADYLETRSTNCGNNITDMLALLKAKGVEWQSIILTQDGTMQRRMAAGLRRWRPDCRIINYAAYRAEVTAQGGELVYRQQIHGMWPVERYLTLLMGEIPRLRDDADGYGPRGKGYIAHVAIPAPVAQAFAALQAAGAAPVRPANPAFASEQR